MHALMAAVPTGDPCRLEANISGICFKIPSIPSRFAASGTTNPVGSGAYGSSTSGTTS